MGLTFALYAFAYMLGGVLTGVIIDLPSMARNKKLAMVCGWAALALGHLTLGPVSSLLPDQAIPVSLASMVVVGLGSGALVVPVMPDMRVGLAEEDIPILSASFATSFSLGAFMGPLVIPAVWHLVGFSTTCGIISLVAAATGVGMLGLHNSSPK